MYSKMVLFVGGLVTAVALVASADAFYFRDQVVTAEFGETVFLEILDDPEARAPLVDDVTEQWISDHPDRFRLMSASTPDARDALRSSIDSVMADDSFEVEVERVFADLEPRQEDLGVEEVTLDLGPAMTTADIPAPVRVALEGQTDVVFTRDLSRVSEARSLLQLVTRGGLVVAVIALLGMIAASRSLLLAVRATALFALPLTVAQPWVLDRVLDRVAMRLDDAYMPVLNRSIAQQVEFRFTVLMVAAAVMVTVTVLAAVAMRSPVAQTLVVEKTAAGSAPTRTNVHPFPQPTVLQPTVLEPNPIDDKTPDNAGPTWFDPDEEDRLAS